MASILSNSITFSNFSATDLSSNNRIDLLRHVVCDKFEYWTDDKVAHCYAVLGGTVSGSTLTLTLKTQANATIHTATYVSPPLNRVSWVMDISDLSVGDYTIQAQLSTGSAVSANFTKVAKTNVIVTFPSDGLEIIPQTQSYVSNVTYGMHAAVPIPYNALQSTDKLGLFEDDIRIPCQIEVVDTWDLNNCPKWLHINFNAVYVSGSAKTYKLKIVSDSNPTTNLTITDDTPVYSTSVDASTDIWTTTTPHRWTNGQPIKFLTISSLPKCVTPTSPPIFDNKHVYYAKVLSTTTFTVHPSQNDAVAGTNAIDFLDTGVGAHSVFTIASYFTQAACLGSSGVGLGVPATNWLSVAPHGWTTGQLVKYALPIDATSRPIDALLDPNKVYTITVVNATRFTLSYNGSPVDLTGLASNGYRNFYAVSTITVDNRTIKYQVQRPFAGITKVWYDSTGTATYGNPIADYATTLNSGPHIKDHRGIDWYATHDYMNQVEIEQTGTNKVCIRSEGWYQSYEKAVSPFCRYVTRIHSTLSQAVIRCEHSTIIADNFYQAKIGDIGFNFPLTTGGRCSFGVDDGTINDDSITVSSIDTSTNIITTSVNHGWETGQTVVFSATTTIPSPLVENTTYYIRKFSNNTFKVYASLDNAQSNSSPIDITTTGSGVYVKVPQSNYVHQEWSDSCRSLGGFSATGDRCDGWFSIAGKGVRTTLITKDLWQLFPKEVELSGNGIVYHQWPMHGRRHVDTSAETDIQKLSNFWCFQQGKFLDLKLPSEFYSAINTYKTEVERLISDVDTQPLNAFSSYGAGLAMHNEFTYFFNTIADTTNIPNLTKLYQANPIAMPSTAWNASTQVFGRIAEADSTNFPRVEECIEHTLTGCFNAELIDSYGVWNYGDSHHSWIPREDRAALYRNWFNNHYYAVSSSWLMYLRGKSIAVLDTARAMTGHLAGVDQVRWDSRTGYYTGYGDFITKQNVPENNWHYPGAFWHCKALLHWGGQNYGTPRDDDHSGSYGHWVDSMGLLWSWLIDGNRWAKDGYDLWHNCIRNITGPQAFGDRRDWRMALANFIWAYRYLHDPAILPYLYGLANGYTTSQFTSPLSGVPTIGNAVPNFSLTVTNATDSTGIWSANSVNWTTSASAYNFSRTKTKWTTPTLVRFTTNGTLPAPLVVGTYYWMNVSANTPNLRFKLYAFNARQDCIDNLNTFITYSTIGTGIHTVISGTLGDSVAGPNWYANWSQIWYDLSHDNGYIQFIKDNSGPMYYEGIPNLSMAGTTYEFTGDATQLTQWLTIIDSDTTNRLYRENGTYDYWGSSPGPGEQDGDNWFGVQWPYFLAHLKNAGINDLGNTPFQGAYLQGDSRYTNGMDSNRGLTLMIKHDTGNGNINITGAAGTLVGDLGGGNLLIALNPNIRKHGWPCFTVSSIDLSSDVITTAKFHGLTTGTALKFVRYIGNLPSPLDYDTTYYAKALTGTTLTLHTANTTLDANKVNITTSGSGAIAAYMPYTIGESGSYQLSPIWHDPADPVSAEAVYTRGQSNIQLITKQITYVDNTAGLYKFQVNGLAAVAQPASRQGEVEAEIIHNYNIGGNSVPPTQGQDVAKYLVKASKGYLVPMVKNPIRIVMTHRPRPDTSHGNPNRFSFIDIVDATGTKVLDNYFLLDGRTNGDTVSVIMNDVLGTVYPTPWHVEFRVTNPDCLIVEFHALNPSSYVDVNGYDIDDVISFSSDLSNAVTIAGLMTNNWTSIGGVTLGGSATVKSSFYGVSGNGGLTLSGSAVENIKLANYLYDASGGLVLAGALGAGFFAYNYTANGGLVLEGDSIAILNDPSTVTIQTIVQQRTECESSGQLWCSPEQTCISNVVYKDAVITSITSCTYPDEVTKLLNEDPSTR